MSRTHRRPTALLRTRSEEPSSPLTASPDAAHPAGEQRLGPRLEPRARRRDTAAISAFVRGLTATSGDGGIGA